jgi:Cytochrome c554 and c-prime
MGRAGWGVWSVVVIFAAVVVHQINAASHQLATPDRVQGPGWWPTEGTPPRADYVGAEACTPCHASQATTQPSTAMAQTAMRAGRSDVLRGSTPLTFSAGSYSYKIASDGDQPPLYTVSSGTQSSSAPLTWAFGLGKVGQSFLFDRDGTFYEARVSYFDSIRALAFTPGRAVTAPRDLAEAMARPVDDKELRRCFGCHTTAPTTEGRFDPSSAIPGVTCEACHGPGRRHADAMKLPRRVAGDAPMLNPAKLRPAESVDFCGACHATFFDIALTGQQGIPALRSQPYRLQLSQCWKTKDARLTCVACHDPHRPLVTDPLAYDDRCLSCHVTSGVQPTSQRAERPCPVGNSRCATCHMPKYDVPDMHHQFTDHRIQVPQPKP